MKKPDSPLFRIDMPTEAPLAGRLLVAEPFLREDYFNHSVIALCDYREGHTAMGLVLNKPTNLTLSEAVEDITTNEKIPIFCGGPVSTNRLFYLHNLNDMFPDSRKLADGLYIGGDFERVAAYVNAGFPVKGQLRFFVGYSGWDSGQLTSEIDAHTWAVTDPPRHINLLDTEGSESLWHRVVRSMGPKYRNWLYHPLFPQLN